MPNFGLLQAIQPPSVVAQLPQSNSNGLDSFAGGLMGGLQQGTNIAAQRQQMNQQAQLFPSIMQQNQQAAESGAIDLADKKQGQEDKKTLRDAAKQGEANYLKALSQISPEAVQDFQLKKAQTAEATAKSTLYGEQATGQGLDNYSTSINIQAQINSSALSSQDPAMQQKIYDYGRANAPKAIQELMPKQFDQNTAMATVILAKENIADYQEREGQKNLSTNQKDDNREVLLVNKEKNNTITDGEKLELSRIRERQDAKARGQAASPIDTALAKNDAVAANKAADTRGQMDIFAASIDKAESNLAKTPEIFLGPVQAIFKVAKLSPEAQVLKSDLNGLALQAKELYKLGSGQGFTDADRDFLVEIEGGVDNYKGSLKSLMEKSRDLAETVKIQAWKRENTIRKNSSTYDSWLQDNPEPKASPKTAVPTTRTLNGVVYEQRNGKWYTK